VNDLRDTYLDGDLSSSLTAEVHAHLLQCPACQEQMEMFRACEEVIQRDQDMPELDAGFASRVMANLPKPALTITPRTRQDVRRRSWRIFAGAGLPAAAAVLFLCVLIWPTTPEPNGIVLPAKLEAPATATTGINEIVDPALNTLIGTRDAIQNVTDTVGIGLKDAGKELANEAGVSPATQPVSLLDVLLSPFSDALTPIPMDASKNEDKPELVRF
jgi:hypothetical protein